MATHGKEAWPEEWPTPRTPLRIGEAAKLIGRNKKTLERAREAILNNETGKGVTTDKSVLRVAGLFADRGKGGIVLAGEIYEALGYTKEILEKMGLPDSAPAKPKNPKKKQPREMTGDELQEALKKDAERFNGPLGGPVPYQRMRAVYRELRDRCKIIVQGSIKSVPYDQALGFKSLSDFLRKALGQDVYPFIIPPNNGRPIDLLSSKKKQRRSGMLAFLTLEQWQERMALAIASEQGREKAGSEAAELSAITGEGKVSLKGKGRRTLR